MLFTDTDSLTYQIEREDIYSDFWKDKEFFDNSDYREDCPFYDKSNRKVIGKFKYEAGGEPIVEFVGLRSKMYFNIMEGDGVTQLLRESEELLYRSALNTTVRCYSGKSSFVIL